MMLQKTMAIARNGLYRAFTDRIALLFMFAAPIAISLIFALVFSGDGDIELPDSDVVVVNLDEGATDSTGRAVFFGEQYVDVLVDNTPDGLTDLITGESNDDPDDARELVENGDARAALVIPADFSQNALNGDGTVELHYNPSSSIAASIVISVVESITTSLNNGLVAQDILVGGADAYFLQSASDPEQIGAAANDALTQIYSGATSSAITLRDVSVQGQEEINVLSYFMPGMAILFMTFAVAAGARSILEEQQNWTMQRILSTPTPRWAYLLGAMGGIFVTGLLQMLILLIVTPLLSLMISGDPDVWGTNIIGIGLVTISVVAAGTGLGLVIAGVSKTPDQANTIATGVLFLMAAVGGAFIQVDNVPGVNQLSFLTLNRWGLDGYLELAVNDASVADILPHVGALSLMTLIFFSIALYGFNRRLDF